MEGSRSRWREALVPWVTLISCVGLLGAGVASYSNVEFAGQASLARLAAEVSEAVVLQWEALRREPAWSAGEGLTWSSQPGAPVAEALAWQAPEGEAVVQALLSEARRLDLEEGDSAQALGLLIDLLGRDPDPVRRARARLYAIQLAVRLERRALAFEQWELSRTELSGLEADSQTSLLLLSGLAVAPALSQLQRSQVRDELVELWVSGGLLLPPAEFEGNPLRVAYRRRLQALDRAAGPDPRLDAYVSVARGQALELLLGEALSGPQDGSLALRSLGSQGLAYRRISPQQFAGCLLPKGELARRLAEQVTRSGILPEGFSLDLSPALDGPGETVHEPVELETLGRSFALRHRDPGSAVAAVQDRQLLLSFGFVALALGLAVAGLSVFRSIRRERRLAQLKSLFVANVSHELRTPVASILLMAENLEEDRVTEPEARARYFRSIRREADRLRRLVNDVLDFSRIERGKPMAMALEPLDLDQLVSELEAQALDRVEAKSGALEFSWDGIALALNADSEALCRATMNLVENALRHSGQSNVVLQLHADAQGGLYIRVSDSGRGVPADQWERLFSPFEQVESTTAEAAASGGTGLGLAIVREIVESHGGTVSIEGQSGPGLTVVIWIPTSKP